MHLDVWPLEGPDYLSSKTQKWLGCYKGSKRDETWQDWSLTIAEVTLNTFGSMGCRGRVYSISKTIKWPIRAL